MTVRRHQVRPLINEVDETNFEEEVGHRNTSQELIAQLYHDDCVDEGQFSTNQTHSEEDEESNHEAYTDDETADEEDNLTKVAALEACLLSSIVKVRKGLTFSSIF